MHKYMFKMLSVIAFFSFIASCGMEPREAAEKYKNEKIALSGIHLDKSVLNDFFTETGGAGVTRDQFLSSLNISKQSPRTISQVDVIVDMSAGMNVGIEGSYDALKAVLNRFNPGQCKYYHVDDDPKNVQPISQIKSLSDAAFLTNKANFVHDHSMLRPAFESASRAKDKVTVIITDFLLDNGEIGDRRLKNGKYIKETADNSTWAQDYFKEWFSGNNKILVYPYQYTAKNYYGKNETKKIYYIIFEPRSCVNPNLDGLKKDFSGLFPKFIELDPSAITLAISESDLPGACVPPSDFSAIKGKGNKAQVFGEYFTEHVPFSFPGIKQNNYTEKPVVCNMVVNNGSPYTLELAVDCYDITKQYYTALETPKDAWKQTDLYKSGKPVSDLTCDVSGKVDATSPLTFSFGASVSKENYMAAYKTLAKMLYSRIAVKSMSLKELDKSLSWDFESKQGPMENSSLRESLHLALDEYASKTTKDGSAQIGSLLVTIHDK